ncbi:MAG: hypothetical protein SXA11_10790 [Cyanobacteriota bacterium]|nr:hypothetical protein [Cyanobacteriota bacterium]
MGTPSRYWLFASINAAVGECQIQTLEDAKAFFRQQFPQFVGSSDVPDKEIQCQLMLLCQSGDEETKRQSDRCLRCFISHQIKEICLDLARRFGGRNRFSRQELFGLLLDDDFDPPKSPLKRGTLKAPPLKRGAGGGSKHSASVLKKTSYQSLASQILQNFDPEKSELSTWTNWMVKCHQPLKEFLLENGIYRSTDWSILNKTTPGELENILSEVYCLSPIEIEQYKLLLESFLAVYRADRLQQRQRGIQKCPPPTKEQLEKIANQSPATTNLSPDRVLGRLQKMAWFLRQYRIASKSGSPPTVEIDNPEDDGSFNYFVAPEVRDNAETDFLIAYSRELQPCLLGAVEKAIANRVSYLQTRRNPKHREFLKAIELFHRGKSMTEIAPEVGCQKQYQVTRLLKLDEFRADVKQLMLVELKRRVLDLAKVYVNAELLQNSEQKIDDALEEEISITIEEAQSKSMGKNTGTNNSDLARAICQYFDERRK